MATCSMRPYYYFFILIFFFNEILFLYCKITRAGANLMATCLMRPYYYFNFFGAGLTNLICRRAMILGCNWWRRAMRKLRRPCHRIANG